MTSKPVGKVIAVDLDGVICDRTKKTGHQEKYLTCFPIEENIALVNKLYDEGYHIKIYTARGMGIYNERKIEVLDNLFMLTTEQLKDWKVKYHELVMGKTPYQLLIDDRAINIADATLESVKLFFDNEPEI